MGRDHRHIAGEEMKLNAPAAERNREPILNVLRQVMPDSGRVLEIAAGTGQHAAHFARAFPALTWQPSDVDPNSLASIAAWRDESGLSNLSPPVTLDVCDPWPITEADVVVCINMIHISPWEVCVALLHGAAKILPTNGVLFLYGPFLVRDRPTSPGNTSFDASLRGSNPTWGLRWLHDVQEEAGNAGLALDRVADMPANNLSVVFRK